MTDIVSDTEAVKKDAENQVHASLDEVRKTSENDTKGFIKHVISWIIKELEKL